VRQNDDERSIGFYKCEEQLQYTRDLLLFGVSSELRQCIHVEVSIAFSYSIIIASNNADENSFFFPNFKKLCNLYLI
jgi:hypothetical protein